MDPFQGPVLRALARQEGNGPLGEMAREIMKSNLTIRDLTTTSNPYAEDLRRASEANGGLEAMLRDRDEFLRRGEELDDLVRATGEYEIAAFEAREQALFDAEQRSARRAPAADRDEWDDDDPEQSFLVDAVEKPR
ncbi:hypothetical protein [Saccharopolyspora taberi]|uniref:Uncharacterized protein n=1 Tax=Saccharopolyspora taberi TaxID=60895 RepID=A0ABN3VL85_9PSEU